MKKLSLLVICFLVILIISGCYSYIDQSRAKKLGYKYEIRYRAYYIYKTDEMHQPYYDFIFYTNDYKIYKNKITISGKHLRVYLDDKYTIYKEDETWNINNWQKEDRERRFHADVEVIKLGS